MNNRLLAISLFLIGILFISASIILTPQFVQRYLSADNNLMNEGSILVRLIRVLTGSIGLIVALLGFLLLLQPSLMQKIKKGFDSKLTLYILAVLFFIYIFIGFNHNLEVYDEGVVLCGSARVLTGDIPYKDFFTLYMPGQFYLLAALFKLFGTSVIVGRIFAKIVLFLTSLLIYLLARKQMPQKFALLAWFIAVMWLAVRQTPTALTTGLFLGLLAGFLIAEFLYKKKKGWLFAAGIVTGLTGLFRQDIGLYIFLTELLVISPFIFVNIPDRDNRLASRCFKVVKLQFIYAIGIIIIVLPICIYFLIKVPLPELIYDLAFVPVVINAEFRHIPYPSILPDFTSAITIRAVICYIVELSNRLIFYLPFILFGLTLIWMVSGIRAKRLLLSETKLWYALFLFFLGLFLFNYAKSAPSPGHLIPFIMVSAALFSLLAYDWEPKGGAARIILRFCLGIAIFSFIANPYIIRHKLADTAFLFLPSRFAFAIERARGIYTAQERGEPLQKAVSYIQERVAADEPIFVGNTRHDSISINDNLLYFLSDRQSMTKYHELYPGIATTDAVQKSIINDLDTKGVRYIVLWSGDENRKQTKRDTQKQGAALLDRYIRNNYKSVAKFGSYTILCRQREF